MTIINFKFKLISMKTITMLNLRQDSQGIIRMLKQGRRLTLTYRGKAVARLEPLRETRVDSSNDPLFQIHKQSQASPLGPLNHDDIDRVVYGES